MYLSDKPKFPEVLIWVSASHLTEPLPDWMTTTEDGMLEFIAAHELELFEGIPPKGMLEHMKQVAADYIIAASG